MQDLWKEDEEGRCKSLLDHGKRVHRPSSPDNLRNNVLRQLNYEEGV